MEVSQSIRESMDFEKLLPKIGIAKLVIDDREETDRIYFFHYENPKGCIWQALYDKETRDYTVQIVTQLTACHDIQFIKSTPEAFWENLLSSYECAVANTVGEERESLPFECKRAQIDTWQYEEVLPESVSEYRLTVTPRNPVRGVNGSYILAEYARADMGRGIQLYFNSYRHDFYGEAFVNGVAKITHVFDAKNLAMFEEVIRRELASFLSDLSVD